ncbi:pyridoxamine 5'-phosphate oxidase family protein [Kitasatospora camelliae]|uniref:Pyridoxamine 5'-phosphate oxidase family protein n=1 Tax=Kitasatospora camelliae TaxID=3156397 RepID=A0AAU8KAD5_9ACTN
MPLARDEGRGDERWHHRRRHPRRLGGERSDPRKDRLAVAPRGAAPSGPAGGGADWFRDRGSGDGTAIAYRTSAGGPAAVPSGSEVAFEVDHVDGHRSAGWSVLISGTAEPVDGPAARQRLEEAAVGAPWAGGRREVWIRVLPATVTGRRIRVE